MAAGGRDHEYKIDLVWTGNQGEGTANYRSYRRDHEIRIAGKPVLPGSSDPHFRGDAARYSPEDLLVASLSACHMLWYLHLCSDEGIVVTEYSDSATGEMREDASGTGEFTKCTLRPNVTIADPLRIADAEKLHEAAHEMCFIARSVRFPVVAEPRTVAVKTL